MLRELLLHCLILYFNPCPIARDAVKYLRYDYIDAPKTITFTPLKDVYNPGEGIQCRADGNPDPAYWWVDLESGNVTSGSTFTVDGSLVDRGEVSFNCTAYVQDDRGEVRWSVSRTIKFEVVTDKTSKLCTLYNRLCRSK